MPFRNGVWEPAQNWPEFVEDMRLAWEWHGGGKKSFEGVSVPDIFEVEAVREVEAIAPTKSR